MHHKLFNLLHQIKNPNFLTAMSDVPPEVAANILSRLPVNSLLRFRSVSKPFRTLIDSPYFVNLQMQQSMKTDKILTVFTGYNFITSFWSLYLDSDLTGVVLDTPFNRAHFPLVLGSCHGWICLCSGSIERTILLWNPSTRKSKLIPTPIDYPPRYSASIAVEQVGYDHVNNDYKVVRLTQSYASSEQSDSKFFVYSLKLNTWQPVEQKFPYSYLLGFYRNQGLCVSGALHWLLNQENNPDADYLIVSFDLASHTFQSVPQPEYSDNYKDLDLGVLGGCLCVVGNRESYNVDIWVMGTYGVKESWSKLVSVTIRCGMFPLPRVRPITYLNNRKEVVLEINHKEYLIYDLERKKSRRVKFPYVCCLSTFVYHETLV